MGVSVGATVLTTAVACAVSVGTAVGAEQAYIAMTMDRRKI